MWASNPSPAPTLAPSRGGGCRGWPGTTCPPRRWCAPTPASSTTTPACPLAQTWGGGEVASADGLRFVVPVRTISAGPPPLLRRGRDVTYFNYTSDQLSGFHAIVIPGTLRDSLYILDGLLEQETSLRPTEVMTDSASYSDQVFGLFRLLGYQFSPRLVDIGDARFWRLDRSVRYGTLDEVARHRIDTSSSPPTGTTCCASPARCSRDRCGRRYCCGSSTAASCASPTG